MRAPLEECLQHLLKHVGVDGLVPYVDVLGLQSRGTIVRWSKGQRPMKGENGIRLAVFLEDIGYQIEETEEISGLMRDILWIIGYGIRSADVITQNIGYSTPSNLFRVLYGRDGAQNGPVYRLMIVAREERNRLVEVQAARINDVAPLRPLVGLSKPYRPIKPETQNPDLESGEDIQLRPLGANADPAVRALIDGVTALHSQLKAASNLPDLVRVVGNHVDPKALMSLRNFLNATLEV